MLKRHGSSSELLPQDVVELILERLPVKSLLRFKSVSNKWKSTIESRHFQQQQFIHRRRSRGPDILFVPLVYHRHDGLNTDAPRLVLGSSIAYTVSFPASGSTFSHGTCDGLVCLYCFCSGTPSVVVNPATRCHQSFPLSSYQHLLIYKCHRFEYPYPCPDLGFGKDKFTGTYKPVWLYNSSRLGLENVTTCEVFDFSTNAWRYLLPASPYPINAYSKPVYLDGSLYWLTACEEPKVLSLDLHTETFQVICKAPFPRGPDEPRHLTICILDNRLCVSEKIWPTQVIWSFHSSGAWKKMCSIDLTKTSSWFGEPIFALVPIAILEKNKLLLQGRDRESFDPLVIHDLHTKSYDLLFKPTRPVGIVDYFQTLLST